MAGNKPILDIKIDDSEFKTFKAKFDEYNAALKTMPGHWQEAGQEIERHASKFAKMFEKLETQGQASAGALTQQVQFNKLLDATELTWASLYKSGKQFATHIHTSTQQLLRWTKLTAVFSGLLGAGGLFGIERMATSVADKRTSAGGLGVSIGQQSSFQTNFARLGNPDAILQGFSSGLSNPVGRAQIKHLLGHEPTGNAARDAADALPKFKELVDSTNPAIVDKVLESLGYTKLGLGHEQAQIIKGMSSEDVAKMSGQFSSDAVKFGLSDPEAKIWTDLKQSLESAGKEIESVLVVGSKNLIQPIEDLSVSFVGLIDHLLKGKHIPGWIKSVGKGIDDFATSVGGGGFQKSVGEYSRDVVDAAKLIESMIAAAPGSIATILGVGLAGRYLGGAAVRAGSALGRAGVVGAAGGLALPGAIAAGGLAATSTPLNAGEDERARQRRYGHPSPGSNSPSPNGSPSSSPAGHPAASQGGSTPHGGGDVVTPGTRTNMPSNQRHAGGGTALLGDVTHHPRRYQGTMTIGDQNFDYASGTNRYLPSFAGHGVSSPFGDHPITGFDPHALRGRGGGAFRTADTYDPQTGGTRTAVEIHMSHQSDINRVETAGCFGIPQHEWGSAKVALQEYLRTHPGGATLRVHPNGHAEVVPRGAARSSLTGHVHGALHGNALRGSFGHPNMGHHPATIGHAQRHTMIDDQSGGLVNVSYSHIARSGQGSTQSSVGSKATEGQMSGETTPQHKENVLGMRTTPRESHTYGNLEDRRNLSSTSQSDRFMLGGFKDKLSNMHGHRRTGPSPMLRNIKIPKAASLPSLKDNPFSKKHQKQAFEEQM